MESEDIALLAQQFERASLRTRPFIFAGLVAIMLGFIILAVYLQQQRQQAEKLRIAAEVGRAAAERKLATAQQLLKSLEALQRGDGTKHSFPNIIAQAKVLTAPISQRPSTISPSVYFYVRDESQRAAVAGKCADLLQKVGYTVVGVELGRRLISAQPQPD